MMDFRDFGLLVAYHVWLCCVFVHICICICIYIFVVSVSVSVVLLIYLCFSTSTVYRDYRIQSLVLMPSLIVHVCPVLLQCTFARYRELPSQEAH